MFLHHKSPQTLHVSISQVPFQRGFTHYMSPQPCQNRSQSCTICSRNLVLHTISHGSGAGPPNQRQPEGFNPQSNSSSRGHQSQGHSAVDRADVPRLDSNSWDLQVAWCRVLDPRFHHLWGWNSIHLRDGSSRWIPRVSDWRSYRDAAVGCYDATDDA
jgi:hypothetical protein